MYTRRQQAPRPPENPSLCVAARRTPSKQIRVARTVGKYIESRYREIISRAKAVETRRQQTLGSRWLLTGAIPSGVPLFARSSDVLPLKYALRPIAPQKTLLPVPARMPFQKIPDIQPFGNAFLTQGMRSRAPDAARVIFDTTFSEKYFLSYVARHFQDIVPIFFYLRKIF